MRSILPSSMRSSAARFQLPWVLLFGPALLLPADLAAAVPAVPLWFSRKPSQDPAGESKLRPTIDVCCIIFRFHPASAARFQLPWVLLFGPALSLPSGLAAAVPAVPLWFSRSLSQDPAGESKLSVCVHASLICCYPQRARSLLQVCGCPPAAARIAGCAAAAANRSAPAARTPDRCVLRAGAHKVLSWCVHSASSIVPHAVAPRAVQ